MTIFSRIFSLLAALPTTKGPPRTSNHTYTLQYTSNSTNFFDKFEVLNLPDPTTGLATYVNVSTARELGLAGISDGRIFLKADNPHNNAENKRDGIWVQGREAFDPGSLFVIDIHALNARQRLRRLVKTVSPSLSNPPLPSKNIWIRVQF